MKLEEPEFLSTRLRGESPVYSDRDLLRDTSSVGPRIGPPSTAATTITVRTLGVFEVIIDGRALRNYEWESEKSRELFALLLAREPTLRKEEIIARLWPDQGGMKLGKLFHSTVYRVRRALYQDAVVETDGCYSLNPSRTFTWDVGEFKALVARAKRLEPGSSEHSETLGQILGLYRGQFMPMVDNEWANDLRAELESQFIDAASKLATALLSRHDYSAAIPICEAVIEHEPYDENACYLVMEAHIGRGDPQSAMTAFRRLAEVLEIDLGVQPGPRLRETFSKARHMRDRLVSVRD